MDAGVGEARKHRPRRGALTSQRDRARRARIGISAAALVLAAGPPSAADGAYVAESFGIASGRGGFAGMIGATLHVRIGFGMRLGSLAIEPWIASAMQLDRDGGFRGIVGGDPQAGEADLNLIGFDARYIVPLHRNLSLHARTGPFAAEGTGALAGYRGRGVGIASGLQLTGKVRALGFLWAPLFFVKRGPMVTGALFLDVGYDVAFLGNDGGERISGGVAHASAGFAVGTAF
jgi:hypothetical protein